MRGIVCARLELENINVHFLFEDKLGPSCSFADELRKELLAVGKFGLFLILVVFIHFLIQEVQGILQY